MTHSRRTQQRIAATALVVVVIVVLVSVLLPNTAIAWMRNHWPWFNRPMLWIEHADNAINLVHAVLFLALGLTARFALPAWRFSQAALAFLLLGAMTEWVQFLVPGRHPRLGDVLVDLAAGMLGWLTACALSAAWRTIAGAAARGRELDP